MVDTQTNAPYHNKALPAGAILREWKLENVLGVGAFGIVYGARGVYFDERVAIKEYFPSAISDRSDGTTVRPTDSSAEEVYAFGLRKFVEEAKILWNLSKPERHPNIVSVKSLFETHGTAYIVMEFESGVSLLEMLRDGKTFDEASLLALIRPIADGLDRVHSAGVTHRDIKPGNILVDDAGRPVLIDFGSARFGAGNATSTKFTFHTPPYAAIEQYMTTYPQGPWTDIYALGVTLYQCVTGEKPPDALERMTAGGGAALSAREPPGFSRSFTRAIDAAMAARPSERPQSVSDWVRMLEAVDFSGADEPTGISVIAPMADEAPAPAITSAAPPARPPSAAAERWAMIEGSLDPDDYADFLEIFPQAEEAFEARRQKRRLEGWAKVDHADLAAVTSFVRSGSFAALEAVAQATADNLAAAAEQSDFLSVPVTARASEARAAALSEGAALARSFGIGLPGVEAWPRPVMVAIPPGQFIMGSPDGEERWGSYFGEEEPEHEVKIDHVFALGRCAVTVDTFATFVADTGHDMGQSAWVLKGDKWEDTPGHGWRNPGFAHAGDHPATCVSWQDAQAFIAWLNDHLKLTDRTDAYRLPSEAEWEYACRAGTKTPFSFGAVITTDQANVRGMVGYGGAAPSMVWRKATTPAGRFLPNAFGLYDMHGNVWECCEDTWNKTYVGAPTDGSAWLTGDERSRRVLRGGSWYDHPRGCRSAFRAGRNATDRGSYLGFRLARTLAPPAS